MTDGIRTYNHTILNLKGAIERLSNDQGREFEILEKTLSLLGDMKYVYTHADTMQKREFISIGSTTIYTIRKVSIEHLQ